MAVFFNDILIYSRTLEDHEKHLQLVLQTLETHSFFAKLSKCSFAQRDIVYLGHVVSREGVKVD